MDPIRKKYLFAQHVLVNEDGPDANAFEVLFSLAHYFGIRVTEGAELAERNMIHFARNQFGTDVPEAFYRGFPKSVRELSSDQLLFDQLVHYTVTYGFGNFSRAGHSVVERDFERAAFREEVPVKEFRILSLKDADAFVVSSVKDMLRGTRPLSVGNFELVLDVIREKGAEGFAAASKDTNIRLLLATRDLDYLRPLSLPDVLKVTERLQWEKYGSDNLKKLNLKNQDRKFLTALIRTKLAENGDFRECYERRALWCGLLHHIHMKAETDREERFLTAMRGRENISAYAMMEKAVASGDIEAAARVLKEEKGSGAVIRHLNYFLSRGGSPQALTPYLKGAGTVLLLQLLQQYAVYRPTLKRAFVFTKLNLLRTHTESDEEQKKRRSVVPPAVRERIEAAIRAELAERWQGKLGKVYLGEDMKRIALPIAESSSESGFGILPKGSRIPLPEGKKLRAFTYWEKVDDIDLSVIGLDAEDRETEFSWRTMADAQSEAVTYSGDQTSGFHGGSEFFDIDLPAFRAQYPEIRRLIFCDNVFTYGMHFGDCVCRAGYMVRDTEDSGAVFEPKTVASAYTVNCPSSFAYLFGLDLETNEFVWLNSAVNGNTQVAGETSVAHLNRLFEATKTMSMYDLLSLQAASRTDDPMEADLAATDEEVKTKEGAVRLHSYDMALMTKLMEAR